MLIAPISVSPSVRARSTSKSATARAATPRVGMLIAWFLVGCVALLCVPIARGGRALGATLPFWLVAAPLIDLAWVERRRIARGTMDFARTFARRRRMARPVRGQRSPRADACRPARS